MEERKTAAIVLCILALAVIVFTVIIPYINHNKTQTIQFKSCTVHFEYHRHLVPDEDFYRAAQNKLALCLCGVYQPNDKATTNRIIKIYKEFGTPVGPDTSYTIKNSGVDTILKYRRMAFDTLILVD
jgi:hypothetical protein